MIIFSNHRKHLFVRVCSDKLLATFVHVYRNYSRIIHGKWNDPVMCSHCLNGTVSLMAWLYRTWRHVFTGSCIESNLSLVVCDRTYLQYSANVLIFGVCLAALSCTVISCMWHSLPLWLFYFNVRCCSDSSYIVALVGVLTLTFYSRLLQPINVYMYIQCSM